jgi:small subunit ribosomal protein S4
MEKRPFAPGQHGQSFRRTSSEYSQQLREKQKLKRIYGIRERQFRNYFLHSAKLKGVTGENLMRLLELRLDNIVFRMGFAPSRTSGRQLVRHNHFTVNDQKVTIPSYQLKQNDVVKVREKNKNMDVIHTALKATRREAVDWLEVDKVSLSGKIVIIPNRGQIPVPVEEQLVVELYSK